MDTASKIKRIRAARGLSQKQIALTIGMDRAQYSRIETGKVEPTLSSLKKIAEVLGVSLAEFFAEEDTFDVNSYERTLVEKLRLVEQLDEAQQRIIYGVIDTAVANKKLKDTLTQALADVA